MLCPFRLRARQNADEEVGEKVCASEGGPELLILQRLEWFSSSSNQTHEVAGVLARGNTHLHCANTQTARDLRKHPNN